MSELEQIKAWLAEGISKSECARRLGVGRSRIYTILEGEIRNDTTRRVSVDMKNRKEFAKAWNDYKSFPLLVDLERHFELTADALQSRVRRYRDFRGKNPQANLDELIWRSNETGSLVAVPEGVLEQLAEFRIDEKKLRNPKGVVVTSAQFGAPLNKQFWDSLNHYCKHKGYHLVVLPIKYGMVKTVYQAQLQKRRLTSTFAEELKGYVLFDDYSLGDITLSTVRMRPTLERFLTDPICEIGGTVSQIFPAPLLELEYRPRINHEHPKAIMTTGAVTHPNYYVDNIGQQDRTGEVATRAHTYSAVVVEFRKGEFHFRQLHSNKRGEFYDIEPKKGGATLFTPKGVKHEPDAVDTIVFGDWHTGKTEPLVRKTSLNSILPKLKPSNLVLHDFVDCESVNFFDERIASRRAHKVRKGWHSLEWELDMVGKELRLIREKTDAFIHVVASNHNGYISNYVERLKWRYDDENLYIGAKLFVMLVEDLRDRDPDMANAEQGDVTQLLINSMGLEKVRAHGRKHTLLLPEKAKNQVLLSMHGDFATGGKHTRSMKAFRKMNARVMIGHNHSGAILGPVWRVGVSTPLTQSYVVTPATSWTNTHGVVFKNGQRQLLNVINGRWHA